MFHKYGISHRVIVSILVSWLLIAANDSYPEVIYSDNFEQGIDPKWQDVKSTRPGDVAIDSLPENVHSGRGALRLTAAANGGQAAVAQVNTWFMPGYDQLYYRWYAKFASDFNEGLLMHWTLVAGHRTDNRWSAFGTAGIKPNGQDFFVTSFEPARVYGDFPPPGEMIFSTYYPDMQAAGDGQYWGNGFKPKVPFVIERGRWYCFEFMVKLNAPGEKNGEQAFWIDGVKIYHQRNMRWRDSDILRLNSFWFSVYIHQSWQDNTCWYDNLVIGTEYVGPLEEIEPGTPQGYDLNRDDEFDLADLLLLLRMKRDDPEDGRADYDRDGRCTMSDVLQLLIDSRKSRAFKLLSAILQR